MVFLTSPTRMFGADALDSQAEAEAAPPSRRRLQHLIARLGRQAYPRRPSEAGQEATEHSYWKGFPQFTARGLLLEHLEPGE